MGLENKNFLNIIIYKKFHMKSCEKCKLKKIRNSYKVCYECNQKEESSSEPEITEAPYKKEQIPKCVRNSLWIHFFKDSRVGVCQCCLREPITISSFHSGHIKAERNGGKTSMENMRPICPMCNLSMGTQDMDQFIARYNLHFGL